MNALNTIKLLSLVSLFCTSLFVHAAEPVITIDENTNTVSINSNGNTNAEILQALASKTGFELSGKLEIQAYIIDYPLTGKTQAIIEKLVKPQSVMVLTSTSKNGNKQVSQVELLPTGSADSQFLNDGKVVGFKQRKLTGDPEKDKFHMEKDKRRNERHARGLGRINQPNFGIVTKEDIDKDKALKGENEQ